MTIENNFMNKAAFTKLVENAAREMKLPYMDAILHICQENNIEPEDAKKYVSVIIKEKLEGEAISLNFLPSQNTLIFE
jgi:hypothetical protein